MRNGTNENLNERIKEDYAFLSELSETLYNGIVKKDMVTINKIAQSMPLIEKRLQNIRILLFSFLQQGKAAGNSMEEHSKELKKIRKKNSTNMLMVRKILALMQNVMEKLDPGNSRAKKVYGQSGKAKTVKTSVFLSRTA
ncbi:MAG: hypothetical protein A2017_17160 [Lentisphaerae bacterium GWF2_44_16]|nr:MAG: hypothetical protein A2017_17160 [Lentisphaerae bacterium GWF2_44_16]